MNQDIREILEQLKYDLDLIKSPSEKIIEMGCFVEVVHLSLKQYLLGNNKKVLKEKTVGLSIHQYWEKRLVKEKFIGLELSYILDAIKDLSEIYWARNKCTHKDPLAIKLTQKVKKYHDSLFDELDCLCQYLSGFKLNEQSKDFEEYLRMNADCRPHFVLLDKLAQKMACCKQTFTNHKKCKQVKRVLEKFCDEHQITYPIHRENIEIGQILRENQNDILRELFDNPKPHTLEDSIKRELCILLDHYKDIWGDQEFNQIINPFILQNLRGKSEAISKPQYKFNTLYITLDFDDPTTDSNIISPYLSDTIVESIQSKSSLYRQTSFDRGNNLPYDFYNKYAGVKLKILTSNHIDVTFNASHLDAINQYIMQVDTAEVDLPQLKSVKELMKKLVRPTISLLNSKENKKTRKLKPL